MRHDTGNKLGFLKAVVYFALKRPDLAEPVHGGISKSLDLKKRAARARRLTAGVQCSRWCRASTPVRR